ncbi:MAG TPA: hypothetical protein VK550_12205 [Polyangiaceae bacterium]|nr:hypothetical protein [Polyangiaceae bacterium]
MRKRLSPARLAEIREFAAPGNLASGQMCRELLGHIEVLEEELRPPSAGHYADVRQIFTWLIAFEEGRLGEAELAAVKGLEAKLLGR